MSDIFRWIEFVRPVYVGAAGYVEKLYIGHHAQNPDRAAVCDSFEELDSGFEFDFATGERVIVPFANIRYTYSREVLSNSRKLSIGTRFNDEAGNPSTPPSPIAPEPKRRGRPPKVAIPLPPISE